MEIIKDSMWKYKLAFDNDLYKIVKRYSFNLFPKAKSELSFEIDFYRTFFSIEQVIDVLSLIKKNKKTVDSFKKVVNKRINYLLFCPTQLVSHYKSIINEKFYDENKKWLLEILNIAKNKGISILPKLFYKNILGKKIFKHVSKICKKYAKRKIEFVKKTKIEVGKEKYYAKNYIESLKTLPFAKGIWGPFTNTNFIIGEDSSFGEGSWLDDKLTYSPNKLILNNNHILFHDDCENQIIKNVYPGHAHFNNIVLYPFRAKRFDNGSSFLINGWNTFALWHFNTSNNIRNQKTHNCRTMQFLLGNKFDQSTINKIFNQLLTYNNKQVAINKLILITQYIGLYESSIIGAIAVEYLLDYLGEGPYSFLKWLSKQNVGNYFENYLGLIKEKKKYKKEKSKNKK